MDFQILEKTFFACYHTYDLAGGIHAEINRCILLRVNQMILITLLNKTLSISDEFKQRLTNSSPLLKTLILPKYKLNC